MEHYSTNTNDNEVLINDNKTNIHEYEDFEPINFYPPYTPCMNCSANQQNEFYGRKQHFQDNEVGYYGQSAPYYNKQSYGEQPFYCLYMDRACSGRESTFSQMKNDIETGWDLVLWSESYGVGDAAVLAACVYFGCAAAYLGQRLEDLGKKVGKDIVEQALRSKGKVITDLRTKTEVQAGTAYWSVNHKVWNPFKQKCEKVTTERYVRLYVRSRPKR